MILDETVTKKGSLGALRKNDKSKPRSPDMIGQMKLRRHTLETIEKQIETIDAIFIPSPHWQAGLSIQPASSKRSNNSPIWL
jgi:hypothetical protein